MVGRPSESRRGSVGTPASETRRASVVARMQQHRRGSSRSKMNQDNDSTSSSSSSSEDEAEGEEEDFDEAIEFIKFKDQCWDELTSTEVNAGIASLTSDGKTAKSERGIMVSIRIRPPRAIEGLDSEPCVTNKGSEIRVQKPSFSGGAKEKHVFCYDHTFNGFSRQLDVFKAMGWPCVRSAWQGYNISIFAYGQTGAGKSHTMMGSDKNPGLVRSVSDFIFDFLDRAKRKQTDRDAPAGHVSISCVEIYNECIRDILAPFLEKGGLGGQGGHSPHSIEGGGARSTGRRSSIFPKPKGKPITLRGGVFKAGAKALGSHSKQERMANLKIRESSTKGVYVEGLSSCGVTATTEMSAVINASTENRQVRATKMNSESSRSHLIFIIEAQFQDGKSKKTSKLNMIDLAGSERSKATGATGDSLKEGANINKSLSTLGRVIAALSDPKSKSKAPFRDSKLTHILKDALSGNSQTSMCAAVHGAALYFEETLSTLRYAASVKKIKTSATINAEAAASDIIAELRSEVVKLSTQLLAAQSAGGGVGAANAPSTSAAKSVDASNRRRASLRASMMASGGGAGGRANTAHRNSIAALGKAAELGGLGPGEVGLSLDDEFEAVAPGEGSIPGEGEGGEGALKDVPAADAKQVGDEETQAGGDGGEEASVPIRKKLHRQTSKLNYPAGQGWEPAGQSFANEPTKKRRASWLVRQLTAGAESATRDDEEAAHDMELAAILAERDELDMQLALRNKERVGLELQLKSKAKELGNLERDLSDQTGELDDLVFALEASNTENKYLHDEISRLKRESRQSLSNVTEQDKDPKAFMKNQVLQGLTSYRQVMHRNETAAEEQKKLRQQMLEQQSDPAKVVEMLATNMGYWLLGQSSGGEGLGADPLSQIMEAQQRANELRDEALENKASSGYGQPTKEQKEAMTVEEGLLDGSEGLVRKLQDTVKGKSLQEVEALRRQLEVSNREKEKMEEQLKASQEKAEDLGAYLLSFTQTRLELEEQIAAQQMLLTGALNVMEGRDLSNIDDWLATAKELNLCDSAEAQTVQRLRSTLVEDEGLVKQLCDLADASDRNESVDLNELNDLLATAGGRSLHDKETHSAVIARAGEVRLKLQRRRDAVASLELAVRSNDARLVQRVLGEALDKDLGDVLRSSPAVTAALEALSHLEQVKGAEEKLTRAAESRDRRGLQAALAVGHALGLTPHESGAFHTATMTLNRLTNESDAQEALQRALGWNEALLKGGIDENGLRESQLMLNKNEFNGNMASLEELQRALEIASRAGIDFEKNVAAKRAHELVVKQTTIQTALRSAVASQAPDLLAEAIDRAESLLELGSSSKPDRSRVGSPISSTSSQASSANSTFLLLDEARAIHARLRAVEFAESQLEDAIASRNLALLKSALSTADNARVGEADQTDGEGRVGHGSALLHTARILCARMETEEATVATLQKAIERGDDATALREALGDAANIGLRVPEIAAAQTVLMELAALHRLREAAESNDPRKLEMAVNNARSLTESAAVAQRSLGPEVKSSPEDVSVAKDEDAVTVQKFGLIARQHHSFNSVAAEVFATLGPPGSRSRRSLVMLEDNLGRAEKMMESQKKRSEARRKSSIALAGQLLSPELAEEQYEQVTNSLAATAALLEELTGMKVVIGEIEKKLPRDLLRAFQTGAFVESCNERFDELAVKGAAQEGLTPDELFPIILEMTQNAPWEISWEQCVKFADIFDADGNGVIDREEFVDFSKFMIVGSLLESMAELENKLRARTASQGGEVVLSLADLSSEELIVRVEGNANLVEDLLPLLPEDIYNYLSGDDFLKACREKFDKTDVDASGDLDPDELLPIINEIARRQSFRVSTEQAVRFCKIFDDDGNGVLDREEFVRLHRFVVLMGTVETAAGTDVRKHPAVASEKRRRDSTSLVANPVYVAREEKGAVKPQESVHSTSSRHVATHSATSGMRGSETPVLTSHQRRTSLKQEVEEAAAKLQELDSEVDTLVQRFEHSEAVYEKKSNEQRLRRTASWRSTGSGDERDDADGRLSPRTSLQLAEANQSRQRPHGILQRDVGHTRDLSGKNDTSARGSVTFKMPAPSFVILPSKTAPGSHSGNAETHLMALKTSERPVLQFAEEAPARAARQSRSSKGSADGASNGHVCPPKSITTHSKHMTSPLTTLFPQETRKEQDAGTLPNATEPKAASQRGASSPVNEDSKAMAVPDDVFRIVHGAPRGSNNTIASQPLGSKVNPRPMLKSQQHGPAPRRTKKPVPIRKRSTSRDSTPRRSSNGSLSSSNASRTGKFAASHYQGSSPRGSSQARSLQPSQRDPRGRSVGRVGRSVSRSPARGGAKSQHGSFSANVPAIARSSTPPGGPVLRNFDSFSQGDDSSSTGRQQIVPMPRSTGSSKAAPRSRSTSSPRGGKPMYQTGRAEGGNDRLSQSAPRPEEAGKGTSTRIRPPPPKKNIKPREGTRRAIRTRTKD